LEATTAVVEEIFEGGPEQVKDHDVVVAFDAVPADVGNADWIITIKYNSRREMGVSWLKKSKGQPQWPRDHREKTHTAIFHT
jgi:hypothetical protein